MELDDNLLFNMTEQEIRQNIDGFNNWALLNVLEISGFNETFLRELRFYLGDDFIFDHIRLTTDFIRELKINA